MSGASQWRLDELPRFALLKIEDVQRLTSLSRASIYEGIGKHTFPRQRELGGRRVAWVAGEVFDWCQARAGHSVGSTATTREHEGD